MSEQQPGAEEQPIERGAAEEASGAPLTPTEDKARRTPPSKPEPGSASGPGQANQGQ
jgi:hypothetical protein